MFPKTKIIKCLVTAGPTREHLDPVRFISNPSEGKMGWHIANAAQEIGWKVELILGPSQLPDAENVKTTRVVSAKDMLNACLEKFNECDILIMSAAVSDMRPKLSLPHKAKKNEMNFTVEFEPTEDILKTLSKEKKNQILVGFAAETQNLEEYAKKKLIEKNLDFIAANSVAEKSIGFASDRNKLLLINRAFERIDLGEDSKQNLAKKLVQILHEKFSDKTPVEI